MLSLSNTQAGEPQYEEEPLLYNYILDLPFARLEFALRCTMRREEARGYNY